MTRLRSFQSLHARMLALSAIATLVALALAGWAIAGVLERFVTEGLDRRLDAEVSLLASTVDREGRIDRARLRQHLGALEGAGGWRWRILAPNQTLSSRDFPALDPGPPHPPLTPGMPEPKRPSLSDAERLHPLEGTREDGSRVHARELTIQSRSGPVTLVAAAPRAVVNRPILGALLPLLIALLALAILLGGASFLQLRIGLRPIRRLRDQVAALRTGARTIIDEDQPSELRPLAVELNALAEDNRSVLATARLSAANLAHALKTPVSALSLQLRDQPEAAAQVARVNATIRHHLARARSQTGNRRSSTALAPAVRDLVEVMFHVHADRMIPIVSDMGEELTVAVDATDLDELIGNVLDNAVRHASSRVTVIARHVPNNPRRIEIDIADDGAGIAKNERSAASRPGTRLDERGDGHGFGLSIVADLVSLYGGRMEMRDAPAGGLLVVLELPASDS